ncbi:MAG: DUF4105 domain-containing protein [Fibrobacterales bacterium]
MLRVLIAFCIVPLYSSPMGYNEGIDPVNSYLNRAHELDLSNHPDWHKLIHYSMNGSEYTSEIDDPAFFLSAKGKKSPEDELNATLLAFFAPHSRDSISTEKGNVHPLVQYPARYRFLNTNLGFDIRHLPDVDAAPFKKWLKVLSPNALSLVFSSAYMNNPSSMVGHLFLKVTSDVIDPGGGSPMEYGIDFSADVGTAPGIAYIYKGIFGYYKGQFHLYNYKTFIDRYLNMEQRDLWEYKLKLSNDQLIYLFEHLWEIAGSWKDYYFFTENCAYNILALLQVTQPQRNYTEHKNWVSTPIEAIQILLADSIVSEIVPMRSHFSNLESAIDTMSEQKNALLELYTSNEGALYQKTLALDAELAVAPYILDNVIQLLTHTYKDEPQNPHLFQLMVLRQRLPFSSSLHEEQTVVEGYPHQAHDPSRISAGYFNFRDQHAALFEYRFGIHDVNARHYGFLRGSQIQVGQIQLAVPLHYSEQWYDAIQLRLFRPFQIQSLVNFNVYTQQLSWRIDSKVTQPLYVTRSHHYVFDIEMGGGISTFIHSALVFALAEVKGEYDFHFSRFGLGPQLRTGLVLPFGQDFSLLIEPSVYYNVLYSGIYTIESRSEMRYSLNRDIELRLSVETFNWWYHSGIVGNYYF